MSTTILIVDDSATTRAMIKRVITLCGVPDATVIEAGDGTEALAVLKDRTADLVLADLHMPKMGGVEMIERMKADPRLRDIPVFIVSADPNAGRIDQLKQRGARGYLGKPFTPESFRDVLGQILGVKANG